MTKDPFTAKIVSRDARDFARNRKIQKQNTKEEPIMAITEKELMKIRKRFEKQNELIMKTYRRFGDKSILEMLYLDSDDPEEVAEKFGISLEDAAELVEKDQSAKADPIGTMEEASKKASAAIASIFGISDKDEESSEEDEADDTEEEKADYEDSDDNFDEDYDDDSDNDFDLLDLLKKPEKIIEGLCFLGEVIQDTSDKICDALDESVERVMEHDFDD